MSDIIIFLLLVTSCLIILALVAIVSRVFYNMLPARIKRVTDQFFELNDYEGDLIMDQVEVKKVYGPENKKPQLEQLYNDITLLLGERTQLQSALKEIQEIAANSNLDYKTRLKINNIVIAALGYDGQGGRQTVNN